MAEGECGRSLLVHIPGTQSKGPKGLKWEPEWDVNSSRLVFCNGSNITRACDLEHRHLNFGVLRGS